MGNMQILIRMKKIGSCGLWPVSHWDDQVFWVIKRVNIVVRAVWSGLCGKVCMVRGMWSGLCGQVCVVEVLSFGLIFKVQ